jgi:cysteine desulfurase family protein (TIGR01976 family)
MSSPAEPSARVASPDVIRRHFPALERRHGGRPVAYFDGPGGTQVPRHVIEAMSDYLAHHNANTHWSFPTSQETDRVIADARLVLADFLNARPEEISFGANMTTITFHLAQALGRRWGTGDEVVVTELDHHANIDPWRSLERERGVTVRVVRMVPETGQLDLDDFGRLVGERTRLVAVGAASNALGTVNDVTRIAVLARAAGALVFVDAVHYAPHRMADVRAMDCDFLACSAYKCYGPHLGVLYGRREVLGSLDVPKLRPAPDTAPERLETGTQNHEGVAGAAAAVEFLASLAEGSSRRARLQAVFEELHRRGQALFERLWEGLAATRRVRLFGPPPSVPRTPTVSFTVEGVSSGEVAHRLAGLGSFVSHGDFYASTVVERLGVGGDGLVRVGLACYSTGEEVERLLDGVREITRS